METRGVGCAKEENRVPRDGIVDSRPGIADPGGGKRHVKPVELHGEVDCYDAGGKDEEFDVAARGEAGVVG